MGNQTRRFYIKNPNTEGTVLSGLPLTLYLLVVADAGVVWWLAQDVMSGQGGDILKMLKKVERRIIYQLIIKSILNLNVKKQMTVMPIL